MGKKSKSYFIKTFGCQMNKADSERIAGWYQNQGFVLAQKIEEADEVVINTCSVRQSAEDRVLGLVHNLAKKKNQKTKIILTGCMLRYPLKWLQEKMTYVDEFKKIEKFNSPDGEHNSKFIIRNSSTHAWVPIMEGCDNFCTYCVVPYARGRERSRDLEEIVCEAEGLVKRGYKEITLLGQNVNSYGKDGVKLKFNPPIRRTKLPIRQTQGRQVKIKNLRKRFKTPFALLLAVLNEIPGLEKIKFITSNPWDLTDDIIEAMKLPKIERYLHLPVQSGDDEILRKMNRKYTTDDYLKLIQKIRQKIPQIEIGTDIIVGFPGETERQFQNTVDLCKKARFKLAYIAQYSPRPQTAAYKLADNVSSREKERRWHILEKLINAPYSVKTASKRFSTTLQSIALKKASM